MSNPEELKQRFWTSLKSHPLVMLGLASEAGSSRPMTAQLQDHTSSMWFFTSRETALVQQLAQANEAPAVLTYCAPNHDLLATVSGRLSMDMNRDLIERLWNRYVAAWYDGKKDHPALALVRFDPLSAEIWLNESSWLAGVKLLFGVDPKKEYADHVAKVALR